MGKIQCIALSLELRLKSDLDVRNDKRCESVYQMYLSGFNANHGDWP